MYIGYKVKSSSSSSSSSLLLSSTLSLNENNSSNSYVFTYTSIDTKPTSIYSSLTGEYALAGDDSGNIYRSKDYGKSWSSSKSLQISKHKYASMSGCVFSYTGKEILVSTLNDNTIFYSDDYGSRFTSQSSRTCSAMSASKDLTNVVCIAGTQGQTNSILYSNDKGKNWKKSKIAQNQWIGIATNSDFSNIIAVVQSSQDYTYGSSDGGKTFIVLANNEDKVWSCFAASRDLSVLIITDATSKNSHYSVDYGKTWKQIYDGRGITATYQACAISPDGDSFALGFDGYPIQFEHDCDVTSRKAYCHDSWSNAKHGSSTGSFDTKSIAFSSDGKYLYSVDGQLQEIEVGVYSS